MENVPKENVPKENVPKENVLKGDSDKDMSDASVGMTTIQSSYSDTNNYISNIKYQRNQPSTSLPISQSQLQTQTQSIDRDTASELTSCSANSNNYNKKGKGQHKPSFWSINDNTDARRNFNSEIIQNINNYENDNKSSLYRKMLEGRKKLPAWKSR